MNKVMNIKVAGARVKGPNHDECQDEVLYEKHNKYSIIGVSDGAGSKAKSQYGAKAVLLAVRDYFEEYLIENNLSKLSENMKQDLLDNMLNSIKTEALKDDDEPSEFACTLIFIVMDTDGNYVMGHIGDGGVVMLDSDKARILSYPENGEYKNQTYFITDEDAYDHLFIEHGKIEGEVNAFLICTDGISDLLFRKDEPEDIISPVTYTLCSWLLKADDEHINEIITAYEDNLKKHFSVKSHDDLSLCVMVCQEEELGE